MRGFYDRYIMPRLVNLACGVGTIATQRAMTVPHASGIVVEIGFGPGHNLAFYDAAKVKHIIGVDPVTEMTALAKKRLETSPLDVEILTASAEDMPLDNNLADTVVLTYSACTIPSAPAALAEMRRVLKPDGRLLFCEHGRSTDENVARWQDRINPYWNKVSGGCNVNRDIPGLIKAAGFDIKSLETGYIAPFPKFSTYHFRGVASLR
jgi:ubiquinone/menaquinone biosynthesis C-methylase UbiE